MGFTEDLLTGLALDLQAGTLGIWNPTGAYQPGQTGIVLMAFPDKPDQLIALSGYGVADDPVGTDDTIGVQVRTRFAVEPAFQDPRPCVNLADQIFQRWHSRDHFTLPNAIDVTQVMRRSAVAGGQDANGRHSYIQNFYVQASRQSPHRP